MYFNRTKSFTFIKRRSNIFNKFAVNATKNLAIFFLFSICVFPLHGNLDISRAITAASVPLHIVSSRTRTGNLWIPGASCQPLTTMRPQQYTARHETYPHQERELRFKNLFVLGFSYQPLTYICDTITALLSLFFFLVTTTPRVILLDLVTLLHHYVVYLMNQKKTKVGFSTHHQTKLSTSH